MKSKFRFWVLTYPGGEPQMVAQCQDCLREYRDQKWTWLQACVVEHDCNNCFAREFIFPIIAIDGRPDVFLGEARK